MNLLAPLLSVVYPRCCCGCGSVLDDSEQGVCHSCMSQLAITEEAWHRGNRLEMLFKSFAPYQKEDPMGRKFVRGAAFTYYRPLTPIRHIAHSFKFASNAPAARVMGRLAAEHILASGFFSGVDLLIPVPLHEERLEERGFNQSCWIALGIRDVTGIPLELDNLVRTRHTAQQSLKSMEERRQMGSVFAVLHPERLRGKHVMLVDDIITSGTTMARALEPLLPVRSCTFSVFALSFAIH